MFERLLTSFQNILKIPELRTRILFTLGMLVVYRVGAHIPTPGINGEALSEFLQKQGGALLGFLDIFQGVAVEADDLCAGHHALYQRIDHLAAVDGGGSPSFEAGKGGRTGSQEDHSVHAFGTIGIALVQGFGIAIGLEQMNGGAFVLDKGWAFRLMTVITLTAGTGFLMWLGEQITERGIGNGIS